MDLTEISTGNWRVEVGRTETVTSSALAALNYTNMEPQCIDLDNFDYEAYLKQDFLNSNFSLTLADFYLIHKFYYIMYGVLLHIICIGGLIGNILSIVVLTRRNMQSSTSTYLVVLMMCDCVVLLSSYFNEVLGIGLRISVRYTLYVMPFTSVYVASFGQLCRDCGVLLTVAVTVERYIYVCHTFKASTMCTMKRAKIVCTILVLCTVIYHIPTFLSQTVISSYSEQCDITFYQPKVNLFLANYMKFVKAYIHPVLFYIIPILTLSALTFILIREVRRSNMFRQQMSSHQPTDVNVTVVLISVVIVFILCSTPTMVFMILIAVYGTDILVSLAGVLAWHTAAVLAYSNSAVNFILFCTFGEKFRKTFKKTFLQRGPCKKIVIQDHFHGNTTQMASLQQKLLETYPQLEMVTVERVNGRVP